MPKEDTSSASIRQINLVKEALKIPMTAELHAKLEARLAVLQAEVSPDARGAPPAPLEWVRLPEGEAGGGAAENPRLETRPPTPEQDILTDRDIKIAMLKSRLSRPMPSDIRVKYEAALAELQGEKPPVAKPVEVWPLPPPLEKPSEQKAPREMKPPAGQREVTIWTPQGEREIVIGGKLDVTPKPSEPLGAASGDASPPTKPIPADTLEDAAKPLPVAAISHVDTADSEQGVTTPISEKSTAAPPGLSESDSSVRRIVADEWLRLLICAAIGFILVPLAVCIARGLAFRVYLRDLFAGDPLTLAICAGPYVLVQLVRSIKWAAKNR